MRALLPVASIVAFAAACPPASLIGQPCADVGAEECEGDQLIRCDGRFYVLLAPCANQCVTAKPEVAHGADISTDETWTCEEGPHLVERLITVNDGATLTIEAGALLRLQPASRIATTLAGRVEANGDQNAKILVTAKNELSGGFGVGAEGGINVFAVATGEPSVVRHTIIERGIHGLGVFGLSSTAEPPVVEDNTLRDNEEFGIIVACDEVGAPIPDFAAAGNEFFGNGGTVSTCE